MKSFSSVGIAVMLLIIVTSNLFVTCNFAMCANSSSTTNSVSEDGHSGSLHKGSDFKVGPVTDDSKLIKPVAGSNNKSISSDKSAKSNTSSEVDAGMTDERETNQEIQFGKDGKISIGALHVAQDLEIIPIMNSLSEWRAEHGGVRDAHNLDSMAYRQELHEDLFSAFLQTRRVISELDRQISGYEAVAHVLEDKRDQAIRNNNILNFLSNGALTAAQGGLSIGTPTKFQNAGNELAIVAGGLTALIGAYALKIEKGGRRSAELEPNMLAPIFDLTPVEPNKYPPIIWNYLNAIEPGQKRSRREQLIERWRTLKYIEISRDKKSVNNLRELCGAVPLRNKVTIDLLRTRIPMLQDLRSAVAGMNEYLDEILSFVRGPSRIPIKYRTSAKILDVMRARENSTNKNQKSQ